MNLPDKLKEAVYLHYIEGYRTAEIAGMLGITPNAVKKRIQRGRERLRLSLYGGYEARDGREVYCVNWTNIITHQYYYFYIDAKDGHMSWAARSGEDISEAPYASVDRGREQIPVLQKKAEDFMKNEMQETYGHVYVSYLLRQDGNAEGQVSFYLAKEDGSACEIIYLWDGTLTEIDREKDISGREDGKAVELWDGEEYREAVEVFRELEG